MNIHVYILKLKSGRLYVGQSTDPRRRFFEHQSGTGANICKHDRPMEIIFSQDLGTEDQKIALYFEDWVTICMKRKFQSSQVTGGAYCNEQYLWVNNEWLMAEIYRLNEWFSRLSNSRPGVDINEAIISFINWSDPIGTKLK